MQARHRIRQVVNWVNLSTPLGLLIGVFGRVTFTRGEDGLILGRRYRLPFPTASAFTVGNVILVRIDESRLARRPRLMDHEARHATQYAWCLGPVMLVLYVLAAGWSWLLTGDVAARNPFERQAGLADGGYREHPLRAFLRRS